MDAKRQKPEREQRPWRGVSPRVNSVNDARPVRESRFYVFPLIPPEYESRDWSTLDDDDE